ncbi:endolysin [Stenotrophomonas phage BUCT609]|uniref:Endolysin n=1 Tax=Stenotrophomonas phage BUCT609 TaxID=2834250 RepID=A0A8E6PLA2_9CAUD|nr:endolysin [Stenotrophomonas phage BUCT609]
MMGIKQRILALLAGSLLSVAGVVHVMESEGRHLTAYPDPGTGGAPWTICYGHTGKDVWPGLTVTQERCEAWLVQDLREHERHVQRLVKVPLRQGEYDALTSFSFNVGPEALRTSTLLRKLNAGDRTGACAQYPRWIYANKKVLNGLKVRRFEEQTMCMKGGPYVWRP